MSRRVLIFTCLLSGLLWQQGTPAATSVKPPEPMESGWGDREPTAAEIWRQTLALQGKVAFQGDKTIWVLRNAIYRGQVHIKHADAGNYALSIQAPNVTRTPVAFGLEKGATWAHFPDEGLAFFNGLPETRLVAEQILLDRLPSGFGAERPQSYGLSRKEDEIVALTPCYVLEFMPYDVSNSKPVVTLAISKSDFQILSRSHRRRYADSAYFESRFVNYRSSQVAGLPTRPSLPGGVQVDLAHSAANAFRSYATPAQAEAAEKFKIYQPQYLPDGFFLRQVQVLRIFGVPIQILTYSDGLNLLSVCAQPQIQFTDLLFSGLVNLNYFAITARMIGLEPYSPYDYYSRFTPKFQTVVFGDLAHYALQRVSESLPVP